MSFSKPFILLTLISAGALLLLCALMGKKENKASLVRSVRASRKLDEVKELGHSLAKGWLLGTPSYSALQQSEYQNLRRTAKERNVTNSTKKLGPYYPYSNPEDASMPPPSMPKKSATSLDPKKSSPKESESTTNSVSKTTDQVQPYVKPQDKGGLQGLKTNTDHITPEDNGHVLDREQIAEPLRSELQATLKNMENELIKQRHNKATSTKKGTSKPESDRLEIEIKRLRTEIKRLDAASQVKEKVEHPSTVQQINNATAVYRLTTQHETLAILSRLRVEAMKKKDYKRAAMIVDTEIALKNIKELSRKISLPRNDSNYKNLDFLAGVIAAAHSMMLPAANKNISALEPSQLLDEIDQEAHKAVSSKRINEMHLLKHALDAAF